MSTDYSHRESEWLAKVNQSICKGHLLRESLEQFFKIPINLSDPLLYVAGGIGEEQLLWGELRVLILLVIILLQVIPHLLLQNIMKVE